MCLTKSWRRGSTSKRCLRRSARNISGWDDSPVCAACSARNTPHLVRAGRTVVESARRTEPAFCKPEERRMDKRRLGRGLDALIGDGAVAELPPDTEVAINQIQRNPCQPRKAFDKDELASLAASVRAHGILQPIVV